MKRAERTLGKIHVLKFSQVGRVLVLLLVTALLSACGGTTETPAAPANTVVSAPTTAASDPVATAADTSPDVAQASESDALPVDESGQPLVARVNGIGITQAAFDRALARSQQLGAEVADQSALARTVLDILIEQAVIEQAAAEMNIIVSDQEVEADIQNMVTQAGSPEAWTQWMSDNLYTEEEYRQAARSQILTLRVRDQVIADRAGQEDNETLTQVHARHILVSTEAEAQQIMQRLQNGEAFEDLALQFSRDVTTRERGGDLGFFIRENLTTPELADAAFELQPGELTGPIATALGYHILQTIEFGTTTVADEDAARQQESVFNRWLQAEMDAAGIERFLP